jgi:hypothetical protein
LESAQDDEMAIVAVEMLRLVRELIPMLLEGEDPRLETLRRQWQAATATISAASSCGFYADIAVPPEAPRLEAASQYGGNAVIPVSDCEPPAGCVLYVVDGALHFLEVYNVVA